MTDDAGRINPLKGRIVPVRTVQETNPEIEFADAYVVQIRQKCAAQLSKLIDSTYPKDPNRPFTHLRRFVKEVFLPEHLKIEIGHRGTSSSSSAENNENADHVPTIFALIQPPLPEISQLRDLLAPFVPTSPTPPPPTTSTSPEKSTSTDPSDIYAIEKFILTTTVPLYPPLSAAQADHWSKTLWPTGYNAAFARATIAPPPPLLSATQMSIESRAGRFLRLAREVAREAKQLKRGRGVGVVVVDPAIASSSDSRTETEGADGIVAVAGDARFCAPGIDQPNKDKSGSSRYNPNCEGGPECHAVMRVVEMIAIQRRSEDTTSEKHTPALSPLEIRYLYQPATTATEQQSSPSSAEEPVASSTNSTTTRILPRSAGGYLCTDLDIYTTHEPCLSCSMGILLSRFRAVTFLRRGRLDTGGLASEPAAAGAEQPTTQTNDNTNSRENYYGLFWRKELNWRAMCFEFVEDEDGTSTTTTTEEEEEEEEDCEEPGEFHA